MEEWIANRQQPKKPENKRCYSAKLHLPILFFCLSMPRVRIDETLKMENKSWHAFSPDKPKILINVRSYVRIYVNQIGFSVFLF